MISIFPTSENEALRFKKCTASSEKTDSKSIALQKMKRFGPFSTIDRFTKYHSF